VRAQQQVVGDLSDRRPAPVVMTLDREHELMLGRAQADRACLSLTPFFEAAEIRTKGEQTLKLASGKSGHQ
jgi:hypothetical protein